MKFKMYKDKYYLPHKGWVYGPVIEIGKYKYIGEAAQEVGVFLIVVTHVAFLGLIIWFFTHFFPSSY